ncbi:alpha/beta fold hydrolase [Salinigranum salinum]|uniref:alpha/beta fold hydrolase n=1 Tax=Salinigranum salinum TaxID=1364937 RepID=UPI001260AB1C|nr:alpha/beta hydrolase [Salinigranum salinum]
MTASERTGRAPPTADVESTTRIVEIESGSFPVIDHGEGPAVLLLHGMPDSRHLWRHQIPALADAGFRVVAPDMRGFGDAPRPEGIDAYALPNAIGDVTGLVDAMGVSTVRLVGHDWGAGVGWLLAATRPDLVERLVAISVGAPGNSGTRTIEQRERSWYVYFFQFEGAAEAWLRHDDWRLFREWSRGDGDTERYVEELSRPGALTAALNWYRANLHPQSPEENGVEYPNVTCPVLGVWSDGDNYLTEGYMTESTEKVDGPWRYERIEGASHWVMLDRPVEVNDLLVDFLTDDSITG